VSNTLRTSGKKEVRLLRIESNMATMYPEQSASVGILQTALKRSLCVGGVALNAPPTFTATGSPGGQAGCSTQQAMCACSRKVHLQMAEPSLTPYPWVASPHRR